MFQALSNSTTPMLKTKSADSLSNKRKFISNESQTIKKARIDINVKHSDVLIVQTEDNRVLIYTDWMKQRPITVAAKFVPNVEVDGGRFIVLLPNKDTMEVLTDYAEKVRWVVKARKQQNEGLHPSLSKTKKILSGSDIIAMQGKDRVVLYSDWMKQRANVVAAQFVAKVRNEGGAFVLRNQRGKYKWIQDEAEMINWVKQARKESCKKKVSSMQFSREVRNLVLEEWEPDIFALDMRSDILKATSPCGGKDFIQRQCQKFIAGTPFKPSLEEDEIRIFICKAKTMPQRSDDALYKLLHKLDDEEDAVHLYRNFHDDHNYNCLTSASSNSKSTIALTVREVDILAASCLYNIEKDYTWNLMPYRNQKALYQLLQEHKEVIQHMLKDPNYVQHLNQKVSLLFDEEDF